jgi:hypothetical protein
MKINQKLDNINGSKINLYQYCIKSLKRYSYYCSKFFKINRINGLIKFAYKIKRITPKKQ